MSLNAFTFSNVASGATDSILVTGISGRSILVKAIACECGATATDITFNSKGSGAGTAISMLFANPANGGAVLGYSDGGWFKTSAGEALTCTTGSGSTTGIQVVYEVITVPGVN